MNFYPTIDENGFHAGSLSEAALHPANLDKVVFELVPAPTLEPMTRWRWEDGAWVTRTDFRGHSWYDPENPTRVHHPQAWDDAPPSGWAYWTPGENPVPTPSAALRLAQAEKWAEIKRAREAAEFSTFMVNGQEFDADLKSIMRLQGVIQLAQLDPGQPFSIDWTLANNTTVTLNRNQLREVAQALMQHINAQHVKGRQLRQAVNSAARPEDVGRITW